MKVGFSPLRRFGARVTAAAVAAALGAGGLVGCTIDRASESEAVMTTSQAPAPLHVSVPDGTDDHDPSVPVTVTSAEGLREVTMTN